MEQITVAWMWESCKGVKRKFGFGTNGSKYLRFVAEDQRIDVNKELLGVKSVVVIGTKSSEFVETHWMKFSKVEAEFAHEEYDWRMKTKYNTYNILESDFKISLM